VKGSIAVVGGKEKQNLDESYRVLLGETGVQISSAANVYSKNKKLEGLQSSEVQKTHVKLTPGNSISKLDVGQLNSVIFNEKEF